MSLSETFLLFVRWIHLVSASIWIGGCFIYLVVLRPILSQTSGGLKPFFQRVSTEFQSLVNYCIVVLITSGFILALNRLTSGNTEVSYVLVLSIKSILTLWMVLIVETERRRTKILKLYLETTNSKETLVHRLIKTISGYNAVLILGLVVFFLSDLMKILFEVALIHNN